MEATSLGRRKRGAKGPGASGTDATLHNEAPTAEPASTENSGKGKKRTRADTTHERTTDNSTIPPGEDTAVLAVKRKRRTKAEMERDRLAEEALRLEKESKKVEGLKRVAHLEAQMAKVDAQANQPRRLRGTSSHAIEPLITPENNTTVEREQATELRGRSESVFEGDVSGGETTDTQLVEYSRARSKKKARIPIRQSINIIKEQLIEEEEEGMSALSDVPEDMNKDETTPRGKQAPRLAEPGATVLENNVQKKTVQVQKVPVSASSDGTSNPKLAPMCVVPYCLVVCKNSNY